MLAAAPLLASSDCSKPSLQLPPSYLSNAESQSKDDSSSMEIVLIHSILQSGLILRKRRLSVSSIRVLQDNHLMNKSPATICARSTLVSYPGTTSLRSIPVELLETIFQYVFSDTYDMAARDRWLRSLRKTCPQWQQVVDGMTFRGRNIEWYWNPKTDRLHVK